MRKTLGTVFVVLILLFFGGCVLLIGNLREGLHFEDQSINKPSVLVLNLEGVIFDATPFLEDLHEYAREKDIKGVLIRINSPGGVVGPSEEIYQEIKRIRTELKKPVVVSVSGLAASGAFYAAMGADQIVTNAGSLMGSIGVIMEFANLEKLYEWAKIQRYVVKTGAYKDSGAEYRPMRDDEKLLFQQLANEVLAQFKDAIATSRKLKPELVDQYADGRVITGSTAVSLGFADKIGTFEDARKLVGQLSGLGEDPEIFEPPPSRQEVLAEIFGRARVETRPEVLVGEVLKARLWGQPLFLMPSFLPVGN